MLIKTNEILILSTIVDILKLNQKLLILAIENDLASNQ